MILAACLPIGVVGLLSAIAQGKTAAAAIGIVAKKPEQFGKAMIFPAMVETYAILALLISFLAVRFTGSRYKETGNMSGLDKMKVRILKMRRARRRRSRSGKKDARRM